VDTSFEEVAAQRRVQDVAYSHLSIELDHLYMEDFRLGEAHLEQRIKQVAPWYEAAVKAYSAKHAEHTRQRPRISACFLVDDYFSELPPDQTVPPLLEAARRAGVRIDYLARESACAQNGDIEPAELVAGRLVSVPAQGTTGARPPASESGWLCNGKRTPTPVPQALRRDTWSPPVEAEARGHSIFVDVELWDMQASPDGGKVKVWSCPMLAAVWQLLRLGLLRDHGRTIIQPEPLPDPLPARWAQMPALTQLNPKADPFHGYRTLSLLDDRFLSVEHAVRVILAQVAQDQTVMDRVAQRAEQEYIPLPEDVTGRIAYAFLTDF
jgi:hypothetical protein